MSFNSSSRLDFLSYLQLLFYPDFVLLSKQISHDEAGDRATGWICTVQAIRCNIPTSTILHHSTRANVNTCSIPVCPRAVQYMWNDVLRNPVPIRKGYSVCVCSLCTEKLRRIRMSQRKADHSKKTWHLKFSWLHNLGFIFKTSQLYIRFELSSCWYRLLR